VLNRNGFTCSSIENNTRFPMRKYPIFPSLRSRHNVGTEVPRYSASCLVSKNSGRSWLLVSLTLSRLPPSSSLKSSRSHGSIWVSSAAILTLVDKSIFMRSAWDASRTNASLQVRQECSEKCSNPVLIWSITE